MNAKNELIEFLLNKEPIECASITFGSEYGGGIKKQISLQKPYTPNELKSFFDAMDFKYSSGYGHQELFGTVWLVDGTWLERGEYDGSEWWEHRVRPPIPKELL